MAWTGTCGRVWGHVVGCAGMRQGVGACARGGGRGWGHVAEVEVCGWGQADGMDGDMWHGWGHVAGCGGMWQGWEYVVQGQADGMDGDM